MLEIFADSLSQTSPLILASVSGVITLSIWKFFTSQTPSGGGEIPKLTFQQSDLSDYLLKHCKTLTQPYRLPMYLRSHHLQTVLPVVLNSLPFPYYKFRREYIQLDDGGKVALDWGETGVSGLAEESTILFILPGLTGDNSGFRPLCKQATQQGIRPVFFNKRGHGNSILTTPKLQSFGDTSDMRKSILHIHNMYPNASIIAVGHSAGSGLLACYLGTYQYDSFISSACCISPGYDGVTLFTGGPLPWPYDFLLLRGLKRLVRKHTHILKQAVDVKHVLSANTIREFDDRLYRVIYSLPDLDTYWEINNPMKYVWTIKIPVMCLSSVNDPVIPREQIPYDEVKKRPNALLVTTEYGGHCGFKEQSGLFGMDNWADKLTLDYLMTAKDYAPARQKEIVWQEMTSQFDRK